MTTARQIPKLVGEPVRRREDPRLIQGLSTYVDDIKLPGMLHMAVVRSSRAHARLRNVDTSAARSAPGVELVMTGTEAKAWGEMLPTAAPLGNSATRYPLSDGVVRFVGEGIAAVVASDRYAARDAADLIEVEYEDLPVVVDPLKAMEPGSPKLHPQFDTNVCVVVPVGDKDAADAAFREADVTVKQWMFNHRLIPNPMEPRGVLSHYDPGQETLTHWSSTQVPHLLKWLLSGLVRIPEHKTRVIAPEVGGGFGCKIDVYAEDMLCAMASMRLGKPVKWIEERTENFLTTIHGRDIHAEIELAARSDGRLLGQRMRVVADIGAYQQLLTAAIPTLTTLMFPGLYKVPALYAEVTEVYTNKTPTDAYRGAGRPEATYFIERGMDLLAKKLNMDPAELRRRNFIEKEAFPYKTITGQTYDSGDYEPTLNLALEKAGYADLRRQQEEGRRQGRYLGIGLSTYVEICGIGPSAMVPGGGWEGGTVRVERTGKVTVLTGTSPHGQGGETAFSQIVAEEIGVPIEDVTVLHGDTGVIPFGIGTFGSRAIAIGGTAIVMSVQKVKEKAKKFAGQMLEAQPDDIVYDAGRLYVEGHADKALTIQEVANAAWSGTVLPPGTEPGLEETSYFEPSNCTFPFGAHVCLVEVDKDTGKVEILRYVSVDDCGNVINPLIVEGQVHGGLAQGIGQALMEEAVYGDDGQLITGSFMDYNLPKADQLPSFELYRTTTPTPVNPLGAKGIGEAGTIGSTPCVVNAVCDALAPFGVDHIDMMLRPEKLWRIMNGGAQ
ncbi:MAG TPA: molybdopterin cofactor-binding domain-containing protein [Dehalococcoidia bacterium]|jgi:carbon-monoxide dehydrogenase large subunit